MDVVPGSKGVCIAFRNRETSACGNPGLDGHFLGLYGADERTENVIGAGITDDTVHQVTAALNGASIALTVRRGTFVLPATGGLREPSDRVLPIQAYAR
jgi:hypothetical protein